MARSHLLAGQTWSGPDDVRRCGVELTPHHRRRGVDRSGRYRGRYRCFGQGLCLLGDERKLRIVEVRDPGQSLHHGLIRHDDVDCWIPAALSPRPGAIGAQPRLRSAVLSVEHRKPVQHRPRHHAHRDGRRHFAAHRSNRTRRERKHVSTPGESLVERLDRQRRGQRLHDLSRRLCARHGFGLHAGLHG